MKESISRDEAVAVHCSDCVDIDYCGIHTSYCDEVSQIKAIPAADVIERKKLEEDKSKLLSMLDALNEIGMIRYQVYSDLYDEIERMGENV